jgi:hypothetical protein
MTDNQTGTCYCEHCRAIVSPNSTWQSHPCSCSESGSHRIRTAGTVAYRVRKIGGDGYVYRFTNVPVGWEIVETIVY